MTMMGNLNDGHMPHDVAGWQEAAQSIHIPQLPFELHIHVADEPAIVDLTGACGSSEAMYLRLQAPSTVRFLDSGIEVDGDHLPYAMLLAENARIGDEITVGPLEIAPTTLKACSHGFAPPERCPRWPHS